MHYPGEIEQISWDGKEVVVGLPLCGKIDGSPVAEWTEEIVICEECRSIAVRGRLRSGSGSRTF